MFVAVGAMSWMCPFIVVKSASSFFRELDPSLHEKDEPGSKSLNSPEKDLVVVAKLEFPTFIQTMDALLIFADEIRENRIKFLTEDGDYSVFLEKIQSVEKMVSKLPNYEEYYNLIDQSNVEWLLSAFVKIRKSIQHLGALLVHYREYPGIPFLCGQQSEYHCELASNMLKWMIVRVLHGQKDPFDVKDMHFVMRISDQARECNYLQTDLLANRSVAFLNKKWKEQIGKISESRMAASEKKCSCCGIDVYADSPEGFYIVDSCNHEFCYSCAARYDEPANRYCMGKDCNEYIGRKINILTVTMCLEPVSSPEEADQQ